MKAEEQEISYEEVEQETPVDSEDEDFVSEEEFSKETIRKLKKDLKACKNESRDNLLGWQRSRADYANLQKSLIEEKGKISERAVENFLFDLLPVLDHFDGAMRNKEVWEKVDQGWRSGIEYIYRELVKVLEDNGVQEVSCNGKMDPELHEPIEMVKTDDEKKDHMIESVLQKGYRLKEKTLRAAKVKVYTLSKNE